jgi:hypothetical protein
LKQSDFIAGRAATRKEQLEGGLIVVDPLVANGDQLREHEIDSLMLSQIQRAIWGISMLRGLRYTEERL